MIPNQEVVLSALVGLKKLEKRIENSQKFGQPLPAETTKMWALELDGLTSSLCAGLSVKLPNIPASS